MRRIALKMGLVSLLIVLVAAVILPAVTTRRPFAEELTRTSVARSPVGAWTLQMYPESWKVFALFGHRDEFNRALDDYGPRYFMATILKCLEGGDEFLNLAANIRKVLQLNMPKGEKLEPVVCAWHMIVLTDDLGHSFLGRFTLDKDGKAHRLPVRTVVSSSLNAVLGNVFNLEKKVVRDEKLAAIDLVLVAVDVVAIASVGKGVKLVFKTHSVPYAGKIAMARAVGSSAFVHIKATLPFVAKYGVALGIPYIMLRYPDLITSGGELVASALSVPLWFGEILIWFITLFLTSPLWVPLLPALYFMWVGSRRVYRIARWLRRKRSTHLVTN